MGEEEEEEVAVLVVVVVGGLGRGDSKSSSIHSKRTHSRREEQRGSMGLLHSVAPHTLNVQCLGKSGERAKGRAPVPSSPGRREYGMAGGRDRTENRKGALAQETN